jgi:hypothetical protein
MSENQAFRGVVFEYRDDVGGHEREGRFEG